MPKFYFDFYEDGSLQVDETGLEFQSLDEAELDAVNALTRDMNDERPEEGEKDAYVVIRDEAGQVVSRVAASVSLQIQRSSPPY